eukprot:2488518-Karenia_brevis.AAC.1
MQHKANVLEVASNAFGEERNNFLGGLYDELARKDWEERSALLGSGFDIDKEASKLSEVVLRQARALFDTMFRNAGSKSAQNGNTWTS